MTVDHKGTIQEIFAQLAAEHKDFAMPVDEVGLLESRSELKSRVKVIKTNYLSAVQRQVC